MTGKCPPDLDGHAADTARTEVSVRPRPFRGAGADNGHGYGAGTSRPRWLLDAEAKRYRQARARILQSPRCSVCNLPMTCGQQNVHLSCRPDLDPLGGTTS